MIPQGPLSGAPWFRLPLKAATIVCSHIFMCTLRKMQLSLTQMHSNCFVMRSDWVKRILNHTVTHTHTHGGAGKRLSIRWRDKMSISVIICCRSVECSSTAAPQLYRTARNRWILQELSISHRYAQIGYACIKHRIGIFPLRYSFYTE